VYAKIPIRKKKVGNIACHLDVRRTSEGKTRPDDSAATSETSLSVKKFPHDI
jgi:hypothetical protein